MNSPVFFTFAPLDAPLIQPGTLNTYNLAGDGFATGLGTLFSQAPVFPGGSLSSNGLAFTLPEKKINTGYAQHLVFSVEHQLADHYLVSASHVGSRGLHLTRFATPNAGLMSTPILFFPSAVGGSLSVFDLPPGLEPDVVGRPQQDLGAFTVFENSAGSTYHSLRLAVERRLTSDLQFRVNWTWGHALDEVSDPFDGRGFFSLPQDSSRLFLERASASFDARHRVACFVTWEVPRMGDHPALSGWKVGAVTELQTGQPFTVNSSFDRNLDGNLTDRIDSLNGLIVDPGAFHSIRLEGGTSPANLLAERGQNGRVGRNAFRAQGLAVIDMALSRRFNLSEKSALDLRMEVFNVLNRTHFGIPVRILESAGFGRSFDTQVNPRSIRWGVEVSF